MSAVSCQWFVLMCDHQDEYERRCREFIVPPLHVDPTGRGSIIAGTREAIRVGEVNGWQIGADGVSFVGADRRDLCPTHAREKRAREAAQTGGAS